MMSMASSVTVNRRKGTMPVTITVEDAFALDVQVITYIDPRGSEAPCGEGTNDGCDPTYASACVSDGV